MNSPCNTDHTTATFPPKRKNIVFFLPSVTPWWFDNIILPQVRAFAQIMNVHVIVPSLWRGTGISSHQANTCGNIPNCYVLYMNDVRYQNIRFGIEGYPDIANLVNALTPIAVLCRAPYTNLPRIFDAKVLYIMETSVPQRMRPQIGFDKGLGYFTYSDSRIFDFGYIPPLLESEKTWLESFGRQTFISFSKHPIDRAGAITKYGLSPDNKYVLFPLQYALEENLVLSHDRFKNNLDALDYVMDILPENYQVLGTNHPLNDLHHEVDELAEMAKRHGKRFTPIYAKTAGLSVTSEAMHAASGVFTQNSKVIYEAAYQNIPILRSSKFETAGWINCTYDENEFVQRLTTDPISRDGSKDFFLWFGYHLISELILIENKNLNPVTLVEHITQWKNVEAWEKSKHKFATLSAVTATADTLKSQMLGV